LLLAGGEPFDGLTQDGEIARHHLDLLAFGRGCGRLARGGRCGLRNRCGLCPRGGPRLRRGGGGRRARGGGGGLGGGGCGPRGAGNSRGGGRRGEGGGQWGRCRDHVACWTAVRPPSPDRRGTEANCDRNAREVASFAGRWLRARDLRTEVGGAKRHRRE